MKFALDITELVDGLPRGRSADTIAGQLVRCGTSVGANYRAATRGRSKAEFCAKLGIVEEEADETIFWLELLAQRKIVAKERIEPLQKEANELLSIMIASIRTARRTPDYRPPAPRSAIRNPQSAISPNKTQERL